MQSSRGTTGKDGAVPARYALGAVAMAVLGMFAHSVDMFAGPEPGACKAVRQFLLASEHAAEWQLEMDPSYVADFPKIPFSMVQDCGAPSFRMPYPYQFQFLKEENLMSGDALLELFASKNKTVHYRPVEKAQLDTTPFFYHRLNEGEKSSKASFPDAWACVSRGECTLYFDNSWELVDYEGILSKDVIDTLQTGVQFGSMFLSNHRTTKYTAAFHAAPLKSLAMQMVNEKTWDFISPKNVKKYITPTMPAMPLVVAGVAQNHTRLLEMIPHYRTTTKPGYALYFPEFWTHAVVTVEGVNLMTNWRQDAHVYDQWMASPHTFRNKVKQAASFFGVNHVFPTWWIERKIEQGHNNLHDAVPGYEADLYAANQDSSF